MTTVVTCLHVNPKEHPIEIRDEAEERLAQAEAIAHLALRSADEHGYVNDLDKHVLGAIETLLGQARQLHQAAEQAEQRAAPRVNGRPRRVVELAEGVTLTQ